jgi:hypothetical protein
MMIYMFNFIEKNTIVIFIMGLNEKQSKKCQGVLNP